MIVLNKIVQIWKMIKNEVLQIKFNFKNIKIGYETF